MIFYLQQVDRTSLCLVEDEEGEKVGKRLLPNLQAVEGGYELVRPQPTLLQVYESVMATMPSTSQGAWTETAFSQGVKQGDLAKLLLGFFLYYGSEGSHSFRFYENIASIRLARPVAKPYVQRERDWAAEREDGEGIPSVFTTPGKLVPSGASSPSSIPSVSDIEKGLQGVQLGTPSSGGEEAKTKSPAGSLEGFSSPPLTPRGSAKSRSLTPMISLKPYKPDDTPQKRRAALQSRAKDVSVLEGARNWQVSIEDPFELQHDLGSVIRSIIGQSHIRAELRRAIVVLRSALDAQDPASCSFPTWDEKDKEMGDLLGSGSDSSSLFEKLCEKSKEVPQLPFSCNLCGQEGHREKECPLFICRNCGKQGHYARNCTEPRSARKDNNRGGNRRGDKNNRRKSGGGGGGGRGRGGREKGGGRT